MTPSTVSDLEKNLKTILTRSAFLEMRGLAKEIPIFIQTYLPEEEDALKQVVKRTIKFLLTQGIRVKHVDLFDLVLKLLEDKNYLKEVLNSEADWRKKDLLDLLQNVADPSKRLVPKLMHSLGNDIKASLITGSGQIYPFLRTHSIIEALQPSIVRIPIIFFFPGEYTIDSDGGSYLRLFGSSTNQKLENPHYRAINLNYLNR